MSADLDTALTRLAALAEEATNARWTWTEEHGRDITDEGWSSIRVEGAGCTIAELAVDESIDVPQNNAAFIAAADPPTVAALVRVVAASAQLVDTKSRFLSYDYAENVAADEKALSAALDALAAVLTGGETNGA